MVMVCSGLVGAVSTASSNDHPYSRQCPLDCCELFRLLGVHEVVCEMVCGLCWFAPWVCCARPVGRPVGRSVGRTDGRGVLCWRAALSGGSFAARSLGRAGRAGRAGRRESSVAEHKPIIGQHRTTLLHLCCHQPTLERKPTAARSPGRNFCPKLQTSDRQVGRRAFLRRPTGLRRLPLGGRRVRRARCAAAGRGLRGLRGHRRDALHGQRGGPHLRGDVRAHRAGGQVRPPPPQPPLPPLRSRQLRSLTRAASEETLRRA